MNTAISAEATRPFCGATVATRGYSFSFGDGMNTLWHQSMSNLAAAGSSVRKIMNSQRYGTMEIFFSR